MNTTRSKILTAMALALALAVNGLDARACSIPVFRYALENWPASPYAVYLLHRGPLKGDAAAAAALLRAGASGADEARKGALANIIPVQLDLATTTGQAAARQVCSREPATLPWLLVFAPERRAPGKEIWSGPLTLATARQVIDSPSRRELARRLIAGDSAVWVMLESGDKKQDDRAETGLKQSLAEAARQCEAANRTREDDPAPGPDSPPASIRFSVLRVARAAAAEAPLVGMLLGAEPDLRTFKEPIAFAVIGRGRLLPALVGKGITRDNIVQISGFLTGDCSCQVKDEIPGMDLLLTADWEQVFESGKSTLDEPRPALTGFAGFAEAKSSGQGGQ